MTKGRHERSPWWPLVRSCAHGPPSVVALAVFSGPQSASWPHVVGFERVPGLVAAGYAVSAL